MDVTIIIPCNADRGYLRDAIRSAKNQRGITKEIIVVGRPNPKVSLIAESMGARYLANTVSPTTLGGNINYALVVAEGEYYKVLPDDDTLPPDACKHLLDATEGLFAWVHGNSAYIDERGNKRGKVYKPAITNPTLADLVAKNHIHGGTPLYSTAIHREFGGWREDLWTGEEFEWHLRLLSKGLIPVYVDRVVFNYREHAAQKSTSAGGHGSPYHVKRAAAIKAFRDEYRRLLETK